MVMKASIGRNRAAIRQHHAPTGGTEPGDRRHRLRRQPRDGCGQGGRGLVTGSAALFAETLHSLADTNNQLLLLKGAAAGVAGDNPATSPPLRIRRRAVLWSLLAALGVFVVGGVLSVWEGGTRPCIPRAVQAGLLVPCRAPGCLLDGSSWLGSVRQLRREASARGIPFRQHLLHHLLIPRSRPSSTRTRRRCSGTRSPSPGSGCAAPGLAGAVGCRDRNRAALAAVRGCTTLSRAVDQRSESPVVLDRIHDRSLPTPSGGRRAGDQRLRRAAPALGHGRHPSHWTPSPARLRLLAAPRAG